jgi:alkaline phosphatase D
MGKLKGCFILSTLLSLQLGAQLVAGPMLGPVELREANIWIAVANAKDMVELRLIKKGDAKERFFRPKISSHYEFNTGIIALTGLEPATTYEYSLSITDQNKKTEIKKGVITTKTLFQWRNPAPDFSFLTGSCAYINEPIYDRPGRAYGLDSSIFETMAAEEAAFMLWLGDNWYTREVDYQSKWGMWYRAMHARKLPVMQPFLQRMGHVAIWDDHDFGPNDYGKSFHLKETSRDVFRNFWPNPSYGSDDNGIYTRYQYNDVDFFLLDNRWWRDYDKLPDSINGKPNQEKRMLGKIQMEWLKQELRYSKDNRFINFRVIVNGSQVLNPGSPFDKMLDFPVEYYELMDFIKEDKIEGVLFLSGDRHHSEVIRVKHEGIYPLFDITSSPLSSGTHKFGGIELNNPWRVLGIDQKQNYARVSVAGEMTNRSMKVEFVGEKGELLGSWRVAANELKF